MTDRHSAHHGEPTAPRSTGWDAEVSVERAEELASFSDEFVDDVTADLVESASVDAADDSSESRPDEGDAEPEQPRPTLLEQMGGPMGMLDSGLPVVVFVIVNMFAGLTPGIIAALTAGVAIAILRLVRHKPVSQAIGGLFGVGIAAYIAYRMGSARGYFLWGIWTYVAYGGALLISIVARWPLIGLLWEGLNGRGSGWRRNKSLLYRYDAATLVWVGVFAARFVVQQWLYNSDTVGWLAVARLAMGYPLFIAAILATVLIVGTASGMRLPAILRRRGAEDPVDSIDEEPSRDRYDDGAAPHSGGSDSINHAAHADPASQRDIS